MLNERAPLELDIERLFRAAQERGCGLEINGQPDRLDLTDWHARLARDMGVKLAVSTDAHSAAELDFMGYAVDQARRGWLEAEDVLNTLSCDALRRALRRG